jgi:hypothetical protein
MMELLLARMNANMQEHSKTCWQGEAKTEELNEEIKSGQAEMRSIVNAWIVDMKED